MEDIFALYTEVPGVNSMRPEPSKRRPYEYEYVRNGTANVFMLVDANRSWRKPKVPDRRTCSDAAECMREIRVVLDNRTPPRHPRWPRMPLTLNTVVASSRRTSMADTMVVV